MIAKSMSLLHRGKHRLRNLNYRQTLVYVMLTAIVVFAIGLDRHNRANDEQARCETGKELRDVHRATVEAVYDLATSFSRRPDPSATPEQIAASNQFIREANRFRREMYRNIQPSEPCLRYVDDAGVKPPSPNVPLLPRPPLQNGSKS